MKGVMAQEKKMALQTTDALSKLYRPHPPNTWDDPEAPARTQSDYSFYPLNPRFRNSGYSEAGFQNWPWKICASSAHFLVVMLVSIPKTAWPFLFRSITLLYAKSREYTSVFQSRYKMGMNRGKLALLGCVLLSSHPSSRMWNYSPEYGDA